MPPMIAVGTRWNGHTSWGIETADCGGERARTARLGVHTPQSVNQASLPPDLGIAVLCSPMVTTSSGFDDAGLNSGWRLGLMPWAEGLSGCPTGVQPSGASWTPRLPPSPLLW
ncbi:mCG147795 [Mus musculus]|nr:mCG147795 [Mus musculus]